MKTKARTDYKICPYCGATLDIGEICDCQSENEATERPTTGETGQGNIFAHLPHKTPQKGKYGASALCVY